MGWPRKKKDPISERAQALQAEIDQLEAQIQELSGQREMPQPRLRSTTRPASQTAPKAAASAISSPPPASAREQVFEAVDHERLQAPPETDRKTLYNDLGVRKYDLPGAWQRFKNFFHGAEATNQPFVKLLAAGNIQGLKPLRYEKRIARRRFVLLVLVLFALLWGIIAMFIQR